MSLKHACIAMLLCAAAFAQEAAFPELDKTGAGLIAKEQWAKAEEFYRSALEQARQKSDRPWTAEFLRRIGEVRQKMQDFKGSLSYYEDALALRQEVGPQAKIANLLVGTGWVRMKLGMPDAADRIERGRDLYHQLGDIENEANARLMLAQIAPRFEKAGEQLRALIALYEERREGGACSIVPRPDFTAITTTDIA